MTNFNFSEKEKKVLDFWEDRKIFNKSQEIRKKAKRFVFFEGPPTANGLPHIGLFLTRIYKDLYGRYKTMRGFYVLRKAGWDTHGLPVEIEIEKQLGFKNKKQIEEYGIAKFNRMAREDALKYSNIFKEMSAKMGFWLDLDHPYITYETGYMESVWNIIKKIWDRKLLYLAHRVVPFCTRCGTPLSSHEVAQGYRRIIDKSVFVKFKVKSEKFKNIFILAWTTTPWTLPGNVALAVGASIKYQVVSIKGKDEKYILAADLVGKVLNTEYEIHNTILGKDLVGLEYEPLFDIEKLKSDKSYKIYDADFVSTQEGTGVVHTAVMYGEDDYNLGTKIGLPKFHTVDEQGKFIHVGQGLDGMYVKDKETDKLVIRELEIRNLLFKIEDFEHDYPFCWRCDTPLLYYAKNSWFIKMSAVNKELLKNNQKINWVPGHIKEGRFGQWLKEGKDWAFSRERYWGTPLPIWKCNDCREFLTVGSLDDLEKNRYKIKNEFYILRHGHSEKNADGDNPEIISSRLEDDKYHLTQRGVDQIKKVAKKLKKLGGVDFIIASPFIRTNETAKIIAQELGVKIELEPKIGEINHGSACEGKAEHLCKIVHGRQEWETKTADGESWLDVRKRMSQFILQLNEKYEGKKILIIGHGDPLWLLETFGQGLAREEIVIGAERSMPPQGELRKVDFKNWPYDDDGELDLHRPYIDRIILKCKKCSGKMEKIPDLIDVWFDSGAMPYAQWHWPFENKKMFREQFPANFIVEAIDQTRGWFYTLLAISTLLGKNVPYKNVMVLGHTLDEKGVKMSKSKGNTMLAIPAIDTYGADTLRWYFFSMVSIGESKAVIPREIEEKIKGFFSTLDNCVRFYELYSGGSKTKDQSLTPHALDFQLSILSLLDKWILSKFYGLVLSVSTNLEKYDPTSAARAIERFVVEDLSNWWLRRSRKRKEALGLLRFVLLELAKVIAPFIPFTAEDIHMRLAKSLKLKAESYPESVHLHDWPKTNKKLIDKELEKQMEEVQNIVSLGLAQRKEKQIKVRQPLRAIHLGLSNELPKDLEDLIKGELNVKEIVYDKSQKELVFLDIELDEALIREGIAYELIRQIQDMRKEIKFHVGEKAFALWSSDNDRIISAIDEFKVLVENITSSTTTRIAGTFPQGSTEINKDFEIVPGAKIWIGIKK